MTFCDNLLRFERDWGKLDCRKAAQTASVENCLAILAAVDTT